MKLGSAAFKTASQMSSLLAEQVGKEQVVLGALTGSTAVFN